MRQPVCGLQQRNGGLTLPNRSVPIGVCRRNVVVDLVSRRIACASLFLRAPPSNTVQFRLRRNSPTKPAVCPHGNPLRKLSRLPWGDSDQKWYLSPVEKRVGFNFTCAPTGAVPINPWASTPSHICLTSTNKLHFLGRRYSAPACRTNPKLFRT